jgi:hypothetical protein
MPTRLHLQFAMLLTLTVLAGCATTPPPVDVVIPQSLSVPDDQRLAITVEATGVQIYDCRAAKEPASGNLWTFRAPEAELRTTSGQPFGRHYGGPTWEAKDGSKIVGVVKAKENSPEPNAVPWLLLATGEAYGHGVLAQVKSIQRVKTLGGLPPAASCENSELGREMRVPYQAEYRFFVARL